MHKTLINLFHTAGRVADASLLADRLERIGIDVRVIKAPDDHLSHALRGSLYYFENSASAIQKAKELAKLMFDIERTTPSFSNVDHRDVSHSIWIVGKASDRTKENSQKLAHQPPMATRESEVNSQARTNPDEQIRRHDPSTVGEAPESIRGSRCAICRNHHRSEQALRKHFFRDHVGNYVRRFFLIGPTQRKEEFLAEVNDSIKRRGSYRVSLNKLASGTGVKMRRIISAAEQIGCKTPDGFLELPQESIIDVVGHPLPEKSGPQVDAALESGSTDNHLRAIVKPKSFVELRNLILEGLKAKADETLLREYLNLLNSNLHVEGIKYEIDFRHRRLVRIDKSENGLDEGFLASTKRVKWRLLPPGPHPFSRITKHFEEVSRRHKGVQYDIGRLHKIHSLGPTETLVGLDEFEGYIVFLFPRIPLAVLDCPVKGNAIYVLGDKWLSLSRLTKSQLLNRSSREAVRIVHKGEWFSRLRSLVSTRKLQADLRSQR
jgi:hypothetical protein